MKTIKWVAGNGQEVEVINETEEQNIVDHTVVNKIDEIAVKLGGQRRIYQWIKDGMIQTMGAKIRIPEELQKEVKSMIDDCDARATARTEKREKINKEYDAHYAAVEKMMAE